MLREALDEPACLLVSKFGISTEERSTMLGADEMAEYFDLMEQAKKEEKEKKDEEK